MDEMIVAGLEYVPNGGRVSVTALAGPDLPQSARAALDAPLTMREAMLLAPLHPARDVAPANVARDA